MEGRGDLRGAVEDEYGPGFLGSGSGEVLKEEDKREVNQGTGEEPAGVEH